MKAPKEPKQKTITVKIRNKHLDALEDLLFAELTEEQKEKNIKQATKLWKTLVKKYDAK